VRNEINTQHKQTYYHSRERRRELFLKKCFTLKNSKKNTAGHLLFTTRGHKTLRNRPNMRFSDFVVSRLYVATSRNELIQKPNELHVNDNKKRLRWNNSFLYIIMKCSTICSKGLNVTHSLITLLIWVKH
jgi:hypothetical protein